MTNRLKMAKVNAVLRLHSQGWSHRRIAAHLGIHRETVSRYLAGFSADTDVAGDESENSKPAKAPTGGPLPEPATSAPRVGDSKPAKAPVGSERAEETSAAAAEGGSRSGCARYREKIEAKLEAGLSAQRIFQDLREETDFTGSYYSVRRYVRKLGQRRSLPFRRLEQAPGEEAQVDFGSGAPVLAAEGRKKRTHVFRVVLSHSRKAYSEVVYRQTTEAFLSCLENAFREFNGVPKTLVIDNLRAAVKQADWFDPELNRRLEAFCEHYGVVILPTRPRMPRHKGKVERGVDYVQENALKGRVFESLQAENAFLSQWESSTADTRLHGTTRQQVGNRTVRVISVHLAPVQFPREGGVLGTLSALQAVEETHRAEIEFLLECLPKDIPVVIVGDFNSISTFAAPTALIGHGLVDSFAAVNQDADTCPTWHWPLKYGEVSLRIDYVFHSQDFRTTASRVIRSNASDHYLLVSELDWSGAMPETPSPKRSNGVEE